MTALKRLSEELATWHRSIVFIAGIMLIIALGVGLYTSRSSAERMQAVTHSHQVLGQIHLTVSLLRNAESEQRGFLITGSAGYEAAAEDYAEKLNVALDDLLEMVMDNPRQSERGQELRDVIYARLTELRSTAQITRRRDIGNVRDMLGDESEVRRMADIRRLSAEMTAEEELLLAQRSNDMATELRVATITILTSGGLALLLGVQAFFLLNRSLVALSREAELLRQKENAESADREKSEFLANMSHEIRTPMNSVLGFAELLSGVVATPKQRHYVDAINSSGRAMLSLINDILDLSKIEAGKLELSYQPISVTALLEEIVQVFSQQADARGVQLVTKIDPAMPPALLFDQARLRQILFNVVGNALKFTEEGSVTLAASARLNESDETHATLYLTVTDTGIGIAPEHQTAIFEPFRQVDSGANRGRGGTGLGLSITKRLTDLLNGRVELDSTLGQGTEFRFAFPHIAISSAVPSDEANALADEDFNTLRPSVVLIADDVALNRDLIAGFLEETHHQVVFATNGREAVSQAQKHHPDLILLDLRMPDMDGREALAAIRADDDFTGVPIVSVTASSMMAEEVMLRQEFDGYIRKPFTRSILFQELARLLPAAGTAEVTEEPEAIAENDSSTTVAEAVPGPAWSALLDWLKKVERDRWPQLQKSMGARETAAFAKELLDRGNAAACPAVVAYANKLAEQVERFQISAMETTLRGFPALVKGVAALVSPES